MQESEEKQHVQLPNNMTKDIKLTPKDLLIYLYLKSHFNSKTKEAFPSLEKLHEESGASINTIRKCVDNLKNAKKIEVTKRGRQNIYKFLDFDDGYEPFSYKFLYKEDLTFTEKAQLVATQQYMFKENGEGIIQYSDKEMSQLLNTSETTFRRNVNNLINKGYVEIKDTVDKITGLRTKQKIYHLTKLEQAIVFILKNHEDRLNEHSKDIDELKEFKDFILSNKELQNKFKEYEESRKNLELSERNYPRI